MISLPLRSVPAKPLVWVAVGLLACEILINALLLKPHNDLPSRGTRVLPIPSIVQEPVVQLELVRSEEDIHDILMIGDTGANVKDARKGNQIDSFLFIPVYSAELMVLALIVARGLAHRGSLLFYILVAAICVIAISDWTENAGIARTLNHIEQVHGPQPGDAARISRPSLVKWSLSAVIALALGALAIVQRPWGMRILGLGMLLIADAISWQLILYFRQLG